MNILRKAILMVAAHQIAVPGLSIVDIDLIRLHWVYAHDAMQLAKFFGERVDVVALKLDNLTGILDSALKDFCDQYHNTHDSARSEVAVLELFRGSSVSSTMQMERSLESDMADWDRYILRESAFDAERKLIEVELAWQEWAEKDIAWLEY